MVELFPKTAPSMSKFSRILICAFLHGQMTRARQASRIPGVNLADSMHGGEHVPATPRNAPRQITPFSNKPRIFFL